jgi:hypothetical protein
MDPSHDTGTEGRPPARGPAADQQAGGSADPTARSGDFSQDPTFDPEQLFRVIGQEENAERVSEAMRAFLARRDTDAFERAVAVFVRSARARGDPVERVLAVLIEFAEGREGTAYPHDRTPTSLRTLVLRGVLLAYYGDAGMTARAPGVERRRGGERRHVSTPPPTEDRGEMKAD